MRRASIRTFSLFGESAQLPDPMHIETIAARSSLHEWELAPHRHARLHQLLLLRSGSGRVHLDGCALPLTPMALVNVPAGEVHAFGFEPGTQGWVATFSDDFLDQLLGPAGAERRRLGRGAVLEAEPALAELMAQIEREFEGRATSRALVLRGLCAVLLGHAARAAERADAPRADTAGSALLRRFEALIEERLAERWTVADHARALAVSPTHLSRVVRAATGASALRLIDARRMREARRQLAYTNLPVTTIAYTLGFSDPAYFSRAFARVEGLSPRAFRARVSGPEGEATAVAPRAPA
jgi:AraC family transcriptional regulator, transcriptional activator of pobA